MSYCRFSDDNHRSDVYCYEAAEGWITHVASSRLIGSIPEVDWSLLVNSSEESVEKFTQQLKAQTEFVQNADSEQIELPYRGDIFADSCLEDFYARLLYLREVGYRVPTHVFETIRSEIA